MPNGKEVLITLILHFILPERHMAIFTSGHNAAG